VPIAIASPSRSSSCSVECAADGARGFGIVTGPVVALQHHGAVAERGRPEAHLFRVNAWSMGMCPSPASSTVPYPRRVQHVVDAVNVSSIGAGTEIPVRWFDPTLATTSTQ